ncbi:LEA type 2 family protein, partial [bacterium]|nr:LEA type 2 family protein [bacterium]
MTGACGKNNNRPSRRFRPAGTALIFAALFACSCATLQQMAALQAPALSVEGVRLSGLSFEAADLVLDVGVSNPNPVSIPLSGFDYDLQVESHSLFKGNQASKQAVAAGAKSVVRIPFTLNFRDLYQAVSAMKSRDSVQYRIDCGLSFNVPVLGPVRVPASFSSRLPAVKPPSVKIQSLKVKKTGLTGADLELSLNVSNPNVFSFGLQKLAYDFKVNGLSWAAGTASETASISAKGKQTVRIPVSLNFLQMGQTVAGLLSGDRMLDCGLTGSLDVGTSIPEFGKASVPLELAERI